MGMSPRTLGLTAVAMIAFAANSILCRLALGARSIDPASFSTLRVASGALTLLLLARLRSGSIRFRGDFKSALALGLYMAPFSFAYVELSTGTGALILFACVQLTMLVAAIRDGERPSGQQWLGLVSAAAGLVYLLLPGVQAPSLRGSLFMATAGIAWGIYSLFGRRVAGDPLTKTASNFLWCVPLMLLVSLTQLQQHQLSLDGSLLAIASGALASGCGYAIWYAALRGLSAARAAVVQLSVPVIAAVYGVALMGEALSQRLVLATVAILGGVGLALGAPKEGGTTRVT